jgi:hypothetical protein
VDEASKPASAKRTLKLKPTGGPTPPTPEDGGDAADGTVSMTDSDPITGVQTSTDIATDNGGEPNIIFTLVAVVTLGLLAYYAYLAGTQWMALNG